MRRTFGWSAVMLGISMCFVPHGLAMQTGADPDADPAAADVASGLRQLEHREFAQAKLQFSAAIKLNPRSADAFTWRGISENELKEYREAVRDFESALDVRPNDLPAHYNLALSLIRLGRPNEAIDQLETVVKLKPGVAEPEYNLAILLEDKHATAQAIEHLQAAYQARPDDVAVMQHLVIDLLAAGRAVEAQPVLKLLQSLPSVEALRQVGSAMLEAGDAAQSIPLLESLRARLPASIEVTTLLGRAYVASQEDAKAIQLLDPTKATDRSGESAYLLGLAYLDRGSMAEAKDAFEIAARLNPRSGPALYHLGLMESAVTKQWPRAAAHLREAIQTDPHNSRYSMALAKVLLQQDDARGAMTVLEQVHPQPGEAGERDLLLGIAQIIVSGPARAMPVLERAIAEDSALALAHNMLGFCYFAQGEMAKAASAYAQASDLSPETRLFAHGAAVACDRANDTQQATAYATRAVSLPDARSEDHALYGKLLAKAGRQEDAMRELKEAIALNPNLEEAYYLLGRTYQQAGDNTQASEWMNKLKDVKQRHRTADDSVKDNAKPIASSTLLQGAPVANPDAP